MAFPVIYFSFSTEMGYERLDIPEGSDGWIRSFSPSGAPGGLHFHIHRELEINLVMEGSGSYLIRGGRYPIRTGTLLWLFPAQPHVLIEASDTFRMWVAVFRPKLVKRLTGEGSASCGVLRQRDPGTVFVQELPEEAFRFLGRLFEQLSRIDASDHAWFNAGLGYLLRHGWESGQAAGLRPSESRIHPAVERAIHLLREGGLEGSLVELAARAGISYSRLCGLFRSQTGETLGHFRNRLRVRRFQELASRYPERTLLDLSLEAGFGSYAQCHRMVVRHTGQPPIRLKSASGRR